MVVYPPPTLHDGPEETASFLSNHESRDAQPFELGRTNPNEELEREDLGAGPSIHDRSHTTRWNRFKQSTRRLYKDNIGLLLIVASQSFFACMDLFVKLLTALDNPVPALEASIASTFHHWILIYLLL